MATKRRLGDLYVLGKDQELDDGNGPVKFWLQKLNKLDQQRCFRSANAERSRVTLLYRNQGTDSEEIGALYSQYEEAFESAETMIEFLVVGDLAKQRAARTDEVAAEEEWSKDNYLEGLRDLWNESAQAKLLEDPDDEEAIRVRDELTRFSEAVDAALVTTEHSLRSSYEQYNTMDLEAMVMERLVDSYAGFRWLEAFRRMQTFHAVREHNNHSQRYFGTVEEVDNLNGPLFEQLVRMYDELAVDITSGKD